MSHLASSYPNKYIINARASDSSTTVGQLSFSLKNSPLSDFLISFTGDVYVDNYKRGKIQISDVYNNYLVEGRDMGDSNIKVNDGTISETNSGFIRIEYDFDNIPGFNGLIANVPWINSNNEIVAWANHFYIYPRGITDYELATYDVAWTDKFQELFNKKYAIFPTASCKLYNDDLYIEENVYHFLKHSTFLSGLKEADDGTYAGVAITVGGTYIEEIGLLIADNPELNDNLRFLGSSSLGNRIVNPDTSGAMELFAFRIANIKNLIAENFDSKTTRIYYVPIVTYNKYAYDSDTGDSLYYETEYRYIAGTVKYIDIE